MSVFKKGKNLKNESETAEKTKKRKPGFIDDGRTVYDMSNLPPRTGAKKKGEGVEVTKKEKRAIIKAAYASYAPVVIIMIICFFAVALLLWLWLK
ncbi:MAG: hypothetical protein SOX77_05410 [Candidatus Borkfalkiaceae bacterium]|nr:hypothetical protein [Christensenellaceae bacterium]